MFDFLLKSCFATGVQLAITIVLLLGEERAFKQALQDGRLLQRHSC